MRTNTAQEFTGTADTEAMLPRFGVDNDTLQCSNCIRALEKVVLQAQACLCECSTEAERTKAIMLSTALNIDTDISLDNGRYHITAASRLQL
jgi:hypothetical protein